MKRFVLLLIEEQDSRQVGVGNKVDAALVDINIPRMVTGL